MAPAEVEFMGKWAKGREVTCEFIPGNQGGNYEVDENLELVVDPIAFDRGVTVLIQDTDSFCYSNGDGFCDVLKVSSKKLRIRPSKTLEIRDNDEVVARIRHIKESEVEEWSL